MAQRVRDANLTRSARLSAKRGKRLIRRLNRGVALMYRRTKESGGTWSAKVTIGEGRYQLRRLGDADDHQEANGVDVLDLDQAQAKAIENAEAWKKSAGLTGDDTVAEAAERYLEWFRAHRKGVKETESAYHTHIKPAFGDVKLANLDTKAIKEWLEGLASAPARVRTSKLAKRPKFKAAPKNADQKRARKATANRILTILKAVLNKAFDDKAVSDNSEWRRVKPFKKVDEARIRFLDDAEGIRLLNACPPDLRRLARGALLTGARFGELVKMQVRDLDLAAGRIYIAESKSGKPRHVPLNPEGLALFRELAVGMTGDKLVFTRKDGSPWGKNHHVRALAAACEAAKIKPGIAFHELRHTYASHLAQAGVDLLTISKLLGHADTRVTSKHYAHLADKTLAAAVTKLPSFGFVGKARLAEAKRIKAA